MIQIDGVQVEINSAAEKEIRNDVLEKVSFLLSCVKGTIPMNRDIGLDPDIISKPDHVARNLYTISAIELIDKYEPRVYVDEVVFYSTGVSGNLIPKVVLSYNAE